MHMRHSTHALEHAVECAGVFGQDAGADAAMGGRSRCASSCCTRASSRSISDLRASSSRSDTPVAVGQVLMLRESVMELSHAHNPFVANVQEVTTDWSRAGPLFRLPALAVDADAELADRVEDATDAVCATCEHVSQSK